MNTQDQQFLASIPEKAPRSKLEPHLDFIRGLRKKRRTFIEIAKILADRCGLRVAPSTIFNFLKVRARSKKCEPAAPPASQPVTASDDRIEALRRRAIPSDRPKLFEFTSGEPLQVPRRKDQP